MLNIVELREMNDDRLEDMLEEARKEQFNLRFQRASGRLDNYARLKQVRREIAQLETVLHMRDLAVETAVQEADVKNALVGKEWTANARFVYEDSAWRVSFADDDGNEIASALVNMNKKRLKGRKARRTNKPARLVLEKNVAE